MAVQFLETPPTIVRAGGPRDLAPEVVEFLDALRDNPGKWAEFPGERKTKPLLDDEFKVVGRGGKWYCTFPGEDNASVEGTLADEGNETL